MAHFNVVFSRILYRISSTRNKWKTRCCVTVFTLTKGLKSAAVSCYFRPPTGLFISSSSFVLHHSQIGPVHKSSPQTLSRLHRSLQHPHSLKLVNTLLSLHKQPYIPQLTNNNKPKYLLCEAFHQMRAFAKLCSCEHKTKLVGHNVWVEIEFLIVLMHL